MASAIEGATTSTSRALATVIPDSEPLRNGLAFIYGGSVGALVEVPFEYLARTFKTSAVPRGVMLGALAIGEAATAMMVYDLLEVNMASFNDSLFLMGILLSLHNVRGFSQAITHAIVGAL